MACGEKLAELNKEHYKLKKLVLQFLGAISDVPMRALDCDQDKVDKLWTKLENMARGTK